MAVKKRRVGTEIFGVRRTIRKQTISIGEAIPVHVRKNFDTARRIVDPSTVWPQRITQIHPNAIKYIPFFNYLAFDLFIVTILGVVASTTNFINWAFLVYGVIVLLMRTDSQRIFSAALISLIIIPTANIAERTEVADNFAVMTFSFLLIGLIRAIIELRD